MKRVGRRSRLVGLYCVLILLVSAWRADAQSFRVQAPDRIPAGGEAALYLDWDGTARFEGGTLLMPTGWIVDQVRLLDRVGTSHPVQLQPSSWAENGLSVRPAVPISGERTLVIHARAPDLPAGGSWAFIPDRREGLEEGGSRLIADPAGALRRSLAVTASASRDNHALEIRPSDSPVLIRTDRLPAIEGTSAYTIEAWIRTARTGRIVLSTWTGLEEEGYPIELVVDPLGYLAAYQGVRGNHRSMRSHVRIADGIWHHVAVVHDPDRGWSRLLVDGARSDSLSYPETLNTGRPRVLALGGRPGALQTAFTGEIDELRIWGVARTPAMIRSTVHRHLPQPAAGAVFFPFESDPDETMLVPGSGAARIRPTDLSFRGALADVRVSTEESGVVLTWRYPREEGSSFLVERSSDAVSFEVLGRLASGAGTPSGQNEVQYRFLDAGNTDTVTYYRIRLRRASGSETMSNPVKVGRSEEPPRLALLEGNFPNPFNPTTTIRYRLLEPQDVSVSVWDLSGQMVSLLHSGIQEAGEHAVFFGAETLPSGTYFVRLRSPEGVQSHPMLLMK